MVEEKKKKADIETTPQAGVEDQSLPDSPYSHDDHEDVSWWNSVNGKTLPGAKQDVPSKWKSSSSEEIEKFRHLPFVGRLPWRFQYLTATFVLLASLISLLFIASRLLDTPSSGQVESVYSGVVALEEGVSKSLKGQPIDLAAQKASLAAASAQAASAPRSIQSKWNEMNSLAKDLETYQASAKEVVLASNQIYAITTETLAQVTDAWRRAGNAGEWESVDAVNFAQMMADLQYLQTTAQMISQGRSDVSQRFGTSRQNIEQSLRLFASSPGALQQSNIRQAYSVAASGFSKMRPSLDIVIGRAAAWNNLLGLSEILPAQKNSLIKEMSSITPTASVASGTKKSLWLSGVLIILSLLLILFIGWKQQKWQVLHARSSYEDLQMGVDQISRQLSIVSTGDLTGKVRASSAYFQPMADALNATIQKLRTLVGHVKSTAEEASEAMNNVSARAEELIETSNASVANFGENVESILRMTSTVQTIADLAQESHQGAIDVVERVAAGKSATERATVCMHEVYEKSEEAASRVQRVKRSSEVMQQVSSFQNEISDQIDILAIQAALQATKAGEAGQGFRVVADALKALAQKLSEGSRRVSSLVEANLGDLNSLEKILVAILEQSEDGVKLSDISMENALLVSSTLDQLENAVMNIRTISSDEIENTVLLSENISLGMEKTEQQKQTVEMSAGAMLDVIGVVRKLDETVARFKITNNKSKSSN